jgi:transcriptional regulator with XRE-family HTH domain
MRKGREKAKLSLNDLARELFSSKATVSRWLNAQSLPDEKQVIRWAELCGTDVPTMINLRQQAELDPPASSADETIPPDPMKRDRRIVIFLVILLLCLAGVSLTAWMKRSTTPSCPLDYPISLYVPPQTGEIMDVTAEVKCGLASDRKYLIVEEVPNVDPRNPHPAYYVKARRDACQILRH